MNASNRLKAATDDKHGHGNKLKNKQKFKQMTATKLGE
jgi:hypothetical protein